MPRRSARWPRPAVAVALLLLMMALPAPAFAHANLERSEQAAGSNLDQAPRQLQLYFTETVDPSFSRVQLLDAKRQAVDRGDSRVARDDPRSIVVSVPGSLPNGV